MKKIILAVTCLLVLISCNKFDLEQPVVTLNEDKEAINNNAKSILGDIDPNQDWNSTISGSVTITADAPLNNIAKVQILTESPYINPDAKVLNEADVTNGGTVTLMYDVANIYSQLIVACVSSEGAYYTKGFNIGENNVSFQSTTTRALSRRASEDSFGFPALNNLILPVNDSYPSYGAMRSIRSGIGETTNSIDIWKDQEWDNERLWSIVNDKKFNGSNWYTTANTIRRDATEELSTEDKKELYDIFNTSLFWSKAAYDSLHKNNLIAIRNSEMVKLYNNQLEANGEPVIITPVQATSTDIKKCHLYYYYYNPQDTTGMSKDEVKQFLKNLPKFKAISGPHTVGNYCGTSEFFKLHDYLLPYYGEAPLFHTVTLSDYTTDNKIYRISNAYEVDGTKYYMSYNANYKNYMAEKYDDSDKSTLFQLWQIFKDKEGKCYLYNIGAHSFFHYTGSYNTAFTPLDYLENNCSPFLMEEDGTTYRFARSNNKKQYIGTDFDPATNNNKFSYGIWSNKVKGTSSTVEWHLEEYTNNNWDISLKTSIAQIAENNIVAQAYAIPKGYKIGFMLRKINNGDYTSRYNTGGYTNNMSAETYADGRLNTEVNNFPKHFSNAKTKYGMKDDDPHAAIFNANGKTFITFEDGSDCNYADLIVQLTNGIKYVNEKIEPEAEAYTMCFEDRPLEADYDMNDVVLRCVRKNSKTINLSIVACGGDDNVVIHDATGWQYNNQEVHEAFGVTEPINGHRFINTQVNGIQKDVLSADVTIPEDMSIPQYLKNIYIENKTTNKIIKLAGKGESPFAIIVPLEFDYPREQVSITNAYKKFIEWAQDASVSTDWYLSKEEEQVYVNPFNK